MINSFMKILFICLFLCISGCSSVRIVEKSDDGKDTEFLQSKFEEFNKAYFDNKLNAKCHWAEIENRLGEYNALDNVIYIHKKMAVVGLDCTLLHEMCHATCRCKYFGFIWFIEDHHGPSFIKERDRVAKLYGTDPHNI